MNYIIRKYRENDIPHLVELVRNYLMEDRVSDSIFAQVDFSEEKLYTLLSSNLRNAQFLTTVVIDEAGNYRGGICASIIEYTFSYERMAVDHLIYLDQDLKSSKVLIRLLQSYIDWAKSHNVKAIELSSASGFKSEKFGKLAERLGFLPYCTTYIRRT